MKTRFYTLLQRQGCFKDGVWMGKLKQWAAEVVQFKLANGFALLHQYPRAPLN